HLVAIPRSRYGPLPTQLALPCGHQEPRAAAASLCHSVRPACHSWVRLWLRVWRGGGKAPPEESLRSRLCCPRQHQGKAKALCGHPLVTRTVSGNCGDRKGRLCDVPDSSSPGPVGGVDLPLSAQVSLL